MFIGKKVEFNGVNATGNNPVFANWTEDMQKAYEALMNSYTDLNANDNWKQYDSPSLEGITDAYFGCIDNKTYTGYGHRKENYWYDSNGQLNSRPGREFFAEMFSFSMTNSPKKQIECVQNDLQNGTPNKGVFYDSSLEYLAILKEMEKKTNG